jgi:hypothetical protein
LGVLGTVELPLFYIFLYFVIAPSSGKDQEVEALRRASF